MEGPIFDFTFEEVLAFIESIFRKLKEVFADLGILILPEEGEGHNTTKAEEE